MYHLRRAHVVVVDSAARGDRAIARASHRSLLLGRNLVSERAPPTRSRFARDDRAPEIHSTEEDPKAVPRRKDLRSSGLGAMQHARETPDERRFADDSRTEERRRADRTDTRHCGDGGFSRSAD
ncbi:unnamed protein product [Lasius platythorax]|uniref:Uncharacterized protein n=1 Tax=Lasius platythorax TaxID=488582 RepID=A0AAV2P408_9HYME